jgi:imidazolonepropionase-like amidohydrolase
MKAVVFLQALTLGVCAIAQERPIVFTGARILPIAGPEISAGVVVVQNGRILAVGPTSGTSIPAGAEVRDCTGKVFMPGLVDSHSHIGRIEGGDASAAIQPDVRVLDTFDGRDSRIQKAQAGGITTVNVMPGSGHLLSGQTLYLKLREGHKVDDFLIRLPDGRIAGGIKMANGTNSRRASPFPGTRGKSAAMVREQFVKAQEYRDKITKANGDTAKLPARDLRLEMLAEALEGKRLIQHHTHAHDDIATVLRLAREFGLKVVLQHGTEGYKVAKEIAAAGVPLTTTMIDSPGGKMETRDASFVNPVVLERAGVLVGFNTDDSVTDSRWFLRSAALAVRAGMPRDKALYGVTLANARMLDLQERVGSLEAGKDADLAILSGDPLSIYTKVLETWVEGQKVFDRSNPKDLLYATGGDGASHDSAYGFEVEEY